MATSAKIIAHSRCKRTGKQIVTFELEYPRLIHSELMTHRLFSRNAASSRAIPILTMIEMVRENPAMPVHWGKNQPGMQAREELDLKSQKWAKAAWINAARSAAEYAEYLNSIGAHKQVVNRILEPYQWMKTVLTTTELDNFFWLRRDPDADPTIKELAELMWPALQGSEPVDLGEKDWHVPYFKGEVIDGAWIDGLESQSLEDALAISSSCCAQVSYRKLDDSLEKAYKVYERLVGSEPVHASPFEHQAKPMKIPKSDYWTDAIYEAFQQEGVTHMDKEYFMWSGNFKGWIQHRQLIPNNVCKEYRP